MQNHKQYLTETLTEVYSMFTWVDVCSTQPQCGGIKSAFRRVTHLRPCRLRRRVYFGPFRNNPDNNAVDQIVTRPAGYTTATVEVGHRTINTKNCSLSIVLTATDQKPQKSLRRSHYPPSHCLNVNVMPSNMTFFNDFCGF